MENLPKSEYKGFEYRWDFDDVDKEIRIWFYYKDEWKYFKIELEFKNFIDGL
jgi:hypothetical protein